MMPSEDVCFVCKATREFHNKNRSTGVRYIVFPKLEAKFFQASDEVPMESINYDVKICEKFTRWF